MTQPQLGLRTGLSTTSIGALERAEIRLTDERARRIAEALQLTVAQVNDAYRAARERADDVP
ncbi:helix-turn-helix transcriptional regulator [Williamsia sp. DF01-3]|uniref:helix-turn-helix domain-containing protein n=1 Tax=Williamsia sp. DF01-3 TaxID=2934157 RepID=UPI001FF559E8|nr:helix-turn-helix transcriptional regulator [Williamsia sp. DF01-3]MCK0515752.1 helix-turn-helix domain-containing protein [Williamsia sp. DF01-3]